MRMRTTWAAAAVFTAGTLFGVLTRLPQSTPTLLAQDNAAAVDTLPSWNDGPAKKAIIEFVAKVTKECGPDFVPVAERIAVFDNDGTLWCEQPLYFQFLFAIDRVKALAPDHPEWKDKAPFAALLKGDVKGALAGGERAILEIVMATHAGMTTEEFEKTVKDWIATARHPVSKRLYTEMVYQPMLEVLAYLRANGFKTFIVSGGGIEFMRPWVEKVYGIPPEQVVGSMGKLKYELRDGKPVFVKLPAVDFIDDKEGKPVGIQKFIGRRPIIAFGNSDGDFQMLRWTTSADDRDQPGGSQDRDQPGGSRPRLGLIVHHTGCRAGIRLRPQVAHWHARQRARRSAESGLGPDRYETGLEEDISERLFRPRAGRGYRRLRAAADNDRRVETRQNRRVGNANVSDGHAESHRRGQGQRQHGCQQLLRSACQGEKAVRPADQHPPRWSARSDGGRIRPNQGNERGDTVRGQKQAVDDLRGRDATTGL